MPRHSTTTPSASTAACNTASGAAGAGARPRRVVVLGSTGSIGVNALAVVEHLNERTPGRYEVVGLATGSNARTMLEQARRFQVKHTGVCDERGASVEVPHGITLFRGADAATRLIQSVEADLVVAAIVGIAGLPAVAAAIERGCDVALANKETLAAAGEWIVPRALAREARLLPVDSEHSAIFQCLQSAAAHPRGGVVAAEEAGRASPTAPPALDVSHVRRVVLTASGGPFRTWPAERIAAAGVEDALKHPTWSMGAKITVDSAGMANKALEILEARWLFGLESQRIDVLVHPQSIVHSFVEFVDGSTLAQLGEPDMRVPIQYALTWPRRSEGCGRSLNWRALSRLDFEPPDEARFPMLRLARQVLARGGTAGASLNAANEAAVAAFLDRRIPFGRIAKLATDALESLPSHPIGSLDDVLDADATARRFVQERLP